jgi:hypothetical protein
LPSADALLKERLAAYLRQEGFQVEDYGNGAGVDYPDVAAEVAEAVARGEHDRGPAGLRHRPRHGHRRQQGPRGPRPATEPITSPRTVSSNLRRRRLARRWAADPW